MAVAERFAEGKQQFKLKLREKAFIIRGKMSFVKTKVEGVAAAIMYAGTICWCGENTAAERW